MRVVATAGHVDHGKSSLVLALTGTDPDRWEEEKRRGLTIDLGFAFTTLPSGRRVGFVDVPGHVRFLKNMLAGAGAVQAAVLVVAATEGWMPQAEEHLRILELLGVVHGFTVLTMADVVDADAGELAQLDVMEHIEGTFLAAAPLVVCDSVTGRGVEDVRDALDELLARLPPPADDGRPRLWVDRAFSARGAGTIVTGTLAGGRLDPGDEVELAPAGLRARLRSVQSGHEAAEAAEPGARVALNLAGVEHGAVARGDAVVLAGQWVATDTVDVRLALPAGRRLTRRARVKAYVGSGEHDAAVRPLDAEFARVRLARPLPLAPGDRFVLRDPGRGVTVGGAEVLDVAPPRSARGAPDRLRLPLGERLLASHPRAPVADLARLAGLSPEALDGLVDGLVSAGLARRLRDVILAEAEAARLVQAAGEAVDTFHARRPLEPGMDLAALAGHLEVGVETLRALLGDAPGLVVEEARVRRASHAASASGDPAAQAFLAALDAAPFTPPSPAETGTAPPVVRALVREGAVVEAEGVYFARGAYEEAVRRVVGALRERGPLTVGDVRDLLGSSRKHVLPLLNHLDREGITRRRGDVREPGPRAPDPTPGFSSKKATPEGENLLEKP